MKKVPKQHRAYKLQEISHATLGAGDIRGAVKLPAGENLEDWLAVSVVDFFNELNCLVAPVIGYCTPEKCPEMTAGPGFKYYWQDNEKYKKPTMLPANEYITKVMIWVEGLLNDERIFPSDPNAPFPKDFLKIVQNIFKRLFRIYAHLYHHHRDDVIACCIEENLNSSFRHFMYYTNEFQLIPDNQLEPLRSIIDLLK